MKEKYILASVFVGLVAAPLANAATVKREFPACVSKETLKETIGYFQKGDLDGVKQLMASGACVPLMKGDSISIIDPGFVTATIRYKGVKLYTISEVVR